MRFRPAETPEANRTVLDRVWRKNHLSCSFCKPGKRENAGPKFPPGRRRDKSDWPKWAGAE